MRTERSIILETGVQTVFHTVLLFAVFLLFSGHSAPGGGFAGGLVAGAAVVLRYVAGGPEAVRKALPVAPPTLLGLGVVVAAATGVVSLAAGETFLEHAAFDADLPVLGGVHTTSALPFDIGVFLVVVGLVLTIVDVLGATASGVIGDDEPARLVEEGLGPEGPRRDPA